MQIASLLPTFSNGDLDCPRWINALRDCFPAASVTEIENTLAFAQHFSPEKTVLNQGIWMAAILSELQASPSALSAAILFPLYDQHILNKKALYDYNPDLARVVVGAQQMAEIEALVLVKAMHVKKTTHASSQAEALRKMLLALVNDIRLVLVKLAEKVWQLRHSKQLSHSQQVELAQLIQTIYAPLANRLGIGQLKWEMEDRAFQLLCPQPYYELKNSLDEKRLDRERYIQAFIHSVQQLASQKGIVAEVTGRVKHIYSIWRKMQKKNLSFNELFDVRAVRVLVKDVTSCYRMLSLIHEHYPPIQSEFSDYIASPKANGYRSIHTVVKGPSHKTIEVQIRTFAMHEESEMGVAAHWRYKEGASRDINFESRINWLRSLLEWQGGLQRESNHQPGEFKDDRVYVLTPNGDVLDLPVGATPIDFAYRIHTNVGHGFKGAKVDGVMVPATTALQTGQCVEILTGSDIKPSRDWLDPKAGYLKTSRARQKVRHWFHENLREERLQKGRAIFYKALVKQGIAQAKCNVEELAKQLSLSSGEELFTRLGAGQTGVMTVIQALLPKNDAHEVPAPQVVTIAESPKSRTGKDSLTIDGVNNLMFSMAGCCRPVFGDGVCGYITQGHGVSIHQADCATFARMKARAPDRVVPVAWGKQSGHYPASLQIMTYEREHMLSALTHLLAQQKVTLRSLKVQEQKNASLQKASLVMVTVEIAHLDALNQLMKQIQNLSGVNSVWREK